MSAPKQRRQGGYRPFGVKVKSRPASDARAKCWTAMRVLVRFDIGQLMVTAEAKRSNAQDYVFRLRRAGFVRELVPGNGPARRMAVFQLIRNSGPKAPITAKNGEVYDPNSDTFYAPGGAVIEKHKGERDGESGT